MNREKQHLELRQRSGKKEKQEGRLELTGKGAGSKKNPCTPPTLPAAPPPPTFINSEYFHVKISGTNFVLNKSGLSQSGHKRKANFSQ